LFFTARNGKPLRGGNVIKRVLNPILQQLGIPLGGKLLHAFRHGRVTLLKKNLTPDDLMLQWIGHTSLDMTNVYNHSSEELAYRRSHAALSGSKYSEKQGFWTPEGPFGPQFHVEAITAPCYKQ
jgi:integrase